MSKKTLPSWMSQNYIDDMETTDAPPKRRLRSNYSFKTELNNENKEVKEPVEKYPYVQFEGSIKYFTELHDIAFACDELLQWVEKEPGEKIPMAFDMEWPFSFQTGPGKSALIQICVDLKVCYLFHLTNLKKLPSALLVLLSHKKVILHGVNVKNDLRKLERDFPEAKSQPLIDQCLDLGVYCNEVCDTGGRWSLARLTIHICRQQISKDKSVRMSQWHVIPLNDNQKVYAATDVYIGQIIYYDLERRMTEKEEKIKLLTAKFGEKTLRALDQIS